MNANLLAIVNRIVAEQGEGILADSKSLFPFFSNYAKNESKEDRVAFGRCIEMGAYQVLKKTRTADERRRVKAALADQVSAKTGIDKPRCADALDLLEAVIFKPVRQSSPPPQPQYFPQPQYPPQSSSPAVKKTQTNKGVWGGVAVAVAVVVLVVNYCSNRPSVQPKYTPGTASSPPSTSAPPSSVTATAPQPSTPAPSSGGTATQPQSSAPAQTQTIIVDSRPEKQKQFEALITRFAQEFNRAQNELQESVCRIDRMKAIRELDSNTSITQINGWIGTLDTLGTNREGKAYISIRLNNNLSLCTWNNALSDIMSDTLIPMNSALYNTLIKMTLGQKVKFSGSFVCAGEDYFDEKSVTIRGAMRDPEFIVRFSSVEAID